LKLEDTPTQQWRMPLLLERDQIQGQPDQVRRSLRTDEPSSKKERIPDYEERTFLGFSEH
jgi:hypothetical protein